MITVTAEKRDVFGKKARRASGKLPGVLYGPKEKAMPIFVDAKDFVRAWQKAGETSVLSLRLSAKDEKDVLIHQIDLDPVRGVPIHVDFYAVEKDKVIHVAIPLEFVGTAPAVKELGGTLVKVLHELHVETLPANIPQHLTVDISALLDLNSHVNVKDIVVPNGVKILEKEDEIIASIAAPRTEEEESQEGVEIDLSKIEVHERGKKEEEAGEESEGEGK